MNRTYDMKTLLIVVFIAVTGVLFCCDHKTEVTDDWVVESAADSSETMTEAVQSGDASIYVYVCGAVAEPDVYELQAGARVFEAIAAAGGSCEEADLDCLNLADSLVDGEKIYVPAEGESVEITESTDDKTSDGRVNINTATMEQLQTLPGIGKAKAGAIIEYREANGAFSSVEDLRQVPGIKDGIFGQVQALIRVD